MIDLSNGGTALASRADVSVGRRSVELEPAVFGVEDRQLLAVIAALLSRLIGGHRERRGGDLQQLNRGLRLYANTGLVRGGHEAPPPHPDVAVEGSRHPTAVFRELGTSRAELNKRWRALIQREGQAATFDIALLVRFVPVELWRVLATLIIDGPALATERTERLLGDLASRKPATKNRARPNADALCARTLLTFARPLRRAMALLCELNRRLPDSTQLERWIVVPKLEMPYAPPANTDRSAPPRELVRRAYRELDEEIKHRLRADSTGDEISVIRREVLNALRSSGTWRLLRIRAVFALLCVTGARAEALCSLRRKDYVRRHLGPDGRRGPALALRPGKHRDPFEISWKPIPEQVALLIDAYLAMADRRIVGSARTLWTDDAPLFITTLQAPDRPMDANVVRDRLAGKPTVRALLPRGDDPHDGYSPHSLRRTALQITRDGARRYCEEHGFDMDPEALSEVLLDHDVGSDRYGYADISSPQGREHWTAVATEVTWGMLATDSGGWPAPDVEAYERLLRRRLVLEDEVRRCVERIETLKAAVRHSAATEEATFELLSVIDQRSVLGNELAEVRHTLSQLKHDRATWIVKQDPASAEAASASISRIEAELGSAHADLPAAPILRDWLTVAELGDVTGVSPATPPRWARGELPHKPGDPRRPWEPGAIPIDDSLGPRRRRVWVPGINHRLFRGEASRRRLRELLASWPRGWSRESCETPLATTEHVRSSAGGQLWELRRYFETISTSPLRDAT